jgi:hypothetical protein
MVKKQLNDFLMNAALHQSFNHPVSAFVEIIFFTASAVIVNSGTDKRISPTLAEVFQGLCVLFVKR